MKPVRVILVMTEPPVPFGHAGARWSYVLLKGLLERGHRVVAFAASSKPQAIEAAKETFPSPRYDLRCYPHPVRNRLQSTWRTLRQPYSYMFSPDLRRELKAELDHGFDVLHLEETWTGWLGETDHAAKTVINVHNLYTIDRPRPVVGGPAEKLRGVLQRTAERRLLRGYPMLMAGTPRLQRALKEIAPSTPVRLVPLVLDPALYPYVPSCCRLAEPVVSLIGSMDWSPSRSAAVRLITRLWPAIKRRVTGARLRIVGGNARSALADYAALSDLEIAENVADTKPYFEQTSVLLYAPERGSGVKIKVLEAFAYGVPVVTTSEGVEGLPARDGVHVGLCDDDDGLIERAVALLNDRERQERQRIAARQLLERQHSPAMALDAVERCYAEILARNALAA